MARVLQVYISTVGLTTTTMTSLSSSESTLLVRPEGGRGTSIYTTLRLCVFATEHKNNFRTEHKFMFLCLCLVYLCIQERSTNASATHPLPHRISSTVSSLSPPRIFGGIHLMFRGTAAVSTRYPTRNPTCVLFMQRGRCQYWESICKETYMNSYVVQSSQVIT